MLSKQERDVISKINRSIPREMLNKLMVKEKTMLDEKEKIVERMNLRRKDGSYKVTDQQRKYLNKIISNPLYEQESQAVNDKVGTEIERFVEARIKKEIKAGKLDPNRKWQK